MVTLLKRNAAINILPTRSNARTYNNELDFVYL